MAAHAYIPFAFQFHYGSIRTNQPRQQARIMWSFNSIMVQLEHSATLTLRAATIFQVHYGSIRTLPRLKKNSVNFTFNSIMVQLELLVCDLVRKRQLPFNSIMVQLELVEALSLALFTTASFNSIMVQLERWRWHLLASFYCFQFHYVSIRTKEMHLL